MNKKLQPFYCLEIQKFQEALNSNQTSDAWNRLERAHILGQFFWKEHLHVHYLMFVLSLKTKNFKEVIGQIPRFILAVPGSVFRKAPQGNVGTARVGIFGPMVIPDDLKEVLDSAS